MTRQFPIRTHRLLTFDRLTRFPMVLFLIILPLLIASSAYAQPPDPLWTRTWHYGSNREYMDAIRAIPSGGYIATGFTRYMSTVYQVWTARLDQEGYEIWLNIEGGTSTDAGHYIEPTSDGGFIQCGETWSYHTGVGFDAFIRKLDANGEQEWARVFDSGSIGDLFYAVREVPAGGYIAVGYVGHSKIVRFDASGNVLWEWLHPNPLYSPEWVEPTADGGFVIPTEHFNQDAQTRVFTLYKVSATGSTLWMNDEALPDLPLEARAFCVREDHDGYLYAGGAVRAPNDSTYYDFYVSKRNPDGSIIWSNLVNNPEAGYLSFEKVDHITILADGNVVAGGMSQSSENGYHLWLMKISSDGEINWLYDQTEGEISCTDQGRDGSIVASWYPYLPGEHDSQDLALMKWEPEIEIQLEPEVTIIPPQGMTLHFAAAVSNILLDPTPLDVWATVTTPAGNRFPLQQITVTLQPGGTFYRPTVPLDIPATAPPGEYTYEIHIGDSSPVPPGGPSGNRDMGLGSFTFTKSDQAGNSSASGGTGTADDFVWPVPQGVWDFFGLNGTDLLSSTDGPDQATAYDEASTGIVEPDLRAHPNPFNGITTVAVVLPTAGRAQVVVYNTLGQQVATLADGVLPAGEHTFTFDATHLTSGLYFVRATVPGQFDKVYKVVLMR